MIPLVGTRAVSYHGNAVRNKGVKTLLLIFKRKTNMLSIQKIEDSVNGISISLLSILSRRLEIVAADSSKRGIEVDFNGARRDFANWNTHCTLPSAFLIRR